MTATACPRCSAPFQLIEVEGTSALACPVGHGMWFEHGVLDSIVEDTRDDATTAEQDAAWTASDDSPASVETERYRSCPVCGNTLRKDVWKQGSGVVVDTCDEHGVWVEAGEITRIEAWGEAWARHTAADAQ